MITHYNGKPLTKEMLMPKRYPNERELADKFEPYWVYYGQNGWIKTTPLFIDNKSYCFPGFMMANKQSGPTYFINIPGAPEEVKPLAYPSNKPDREGMYWALDRITDRWREYEWNSELKTNWDIDVTYFIPVRLEDFEKEEDEDVIIWENINGVSLIEGKLGYLIWTKRANPTLLFKSEWLEIINVLCNKFGYDITKREPEIAPCPACGHPICLIVPALTNSGTTQYVKSKAQVICQRDASCGYRGPNADTGEEAIRLHNLICKRG